MQDRTIFRLNDIVDAIDQIELLLMGKNLEDLINDRAMKAAFERFLEILSEASRHIPETLKSEAPEIPWRSVSDIGNYLRHAYHRVDSEILWTVYENGQLAELKSTVIAFLARSK
jgi:uncharacterized protein with HEPN domain